MKHKGGTVSFFFSLARRFPGYAVGRMLYAAANHLPVYACNVLFLRYLMTALLAHRPAAEMLGALAMLAAFLLVSDLISAYTANLLLPRQAEKIGLVFYRELRTLAEEQPLYRYDDPSFLDDLTYVSRHFVQDAVSAMTAASDLICSVLNIVLVLGTFRNIGVVTALLVGTATAVTWIAEFRSKRLEKAKRYEINRLNRKKESCFDCFFSRSAFPELRMTGIGRVLKAHFYRSVSEQNDCVRRYGKKLFGLGALKETVSTGLLLRFALFAYLLYEVLVAGALPGGDFVASYQAATIMAGYFTGVIAILGNLRESTCSYEKYRELRKSAPPPTRLPDVPAEDIRSIELRNVSFTYPGTNRPVLTGIHLHLRRGETVALVGRNGSGKTTLVHLLMGLYTPTEGQLLVNGRPLPQAAYPDYRRKFASFFQGMTPLEATVAQNVALDTQFDPDGVRAALRKASAASLAEKSPDTMVGAAFDKDGLLLSGGEIQKLMLSYCYYSGKTAMVMDEASSALDPMAEKAFNQQLMALSRGRLAVLVSHRLSTVRMADRIYVLDGGTIREQGTHEALLQKHGLYEKMWTVQANRYGMEKPAIRRKNVPKQRRVRWS